MKVLFLQLSDIHWSDSIPSENASRFPKVGSLLAAHFVNPVEAVIFVYGGDFAYSGRDEQYDEIYNLLQEAELSVKEAFGSEVKYFSVGVPGNHDCDFSGDQDAREGLLRGVADGQNLKYKGTFANVLLEPQSAYNEFVDVLCNETPSRVELMSNVDSRIAWYHTIPIGTENLNVVCYNSAWLSRIKEKKGNLALPSDSLKGLKRANFQISLMHHPIQWLETINSINFRRLIFESSDVVFTGHEHASNTFRGELEGSGKASVHEAPAFFPDTKAEEAGFVALYIDTASKQEIKITFLWQNDSFVPYIGKQKVDANQAVLALALEVNRFRRNREWELTESMIDFLENPEVELHRDGVSKIKLPQIFVCPDMRELTTQSNYEKSRTVPGDLAINEILSKTASFVTGGDQSGKTALSKMMMLLLKSEGHLPLWANAQKVPAKAEAFKPFVAELVNAQYGESSVEEFLATPTQEKVLIVDDYQFSHPTLRKDHIMFDIAARFFGRIIVFCHGAEMTPFELGKLSLRVSPKIHMFTLPPLTYKRRLILVEKWLALSPNFGKDVLKDQREELIMHKMVNATVDNYLQPYPPYVLSVLQSMEAGREVDLSTSTHGHMYEVFIKAALARRSTMTNYNVISAFLATLAISCFESDRQHFGDGFISDAYARFQSETDLERDLTGLKQDLVKLRLLKKDESGFSFREKYIYYYFAAFYMKDRLHVDSIRDLLRECASKAWIQDYGNVLLFVAHLSKDPFIVETILSVAKATFAGVAEPPLEGELSFISEPIMDAVVLDDAVECSRDSREAALEAAAHESSVSHTPFAFQRDSVAEDIGLEGELTAAMRTLQVLGQILKNFPANFDPQKKVEIVNECISLGLRSLGRYFEVAEQGGPEMIREFAELVREKLPGIGDVDAKEKAGAAIANFCLMAGFGIVKQTSLSIGSKDLNRTYEKVFDGQLTPAKTLVSMSLALDHSGHFPEDDILKTAYRWADHPYARRVLRTLVVRHFRLFHLSFAIRQRVGAKLDISYKKTMGISHRDKWLG